MKHLQADYNWKAIGDLMLRSAEALQRAGADFLICPDNTIHQAMAHVCQGRHCHGCTLPRKSANKPDVRGYSTLGLTGTKYLVESQVYPEKLNGLGIAYQLPTPQQRDRINRIIFDELVRGIQSLESLFYVQQVMEQMKNNGCDAVVLGCTEIPLLVSDDDSPLPTLDSTRTLARAALREAGLN